MDPKILIRQQVQEIGNSVVTKLKKASPIFSEVHGVIHVKDDYDTFDYLHTTPQQEASGLHQLGPDVGPPRYGPSDDEAFASNGFGYTVTFTISLSEGLLDKENLLYFSVQVVRIEDFLRDNTVPVILRIVFAEPFVDHIITPLLVSELRKKWPLKMYLGNLTSSYLANNFRITLSPQTGKLWHEGF